MDINKILIFGLPGSGKTTFAKRLVENMDVAYFNADEILVFLALKSFILFLDIL